MKSIILKISAFAFAYLSSLNVISQNVNIDYEAWNPTNPPCNVFGTGTSVPATIGGSTNTITHSSLYGQPNYSNSDKALQLQTNYVNGSDTRGTTFRIAYNFKVGYTYEINVNAAVSSTANNGTDPILLLKFSDNTGGTNPPCNGPANMSLNSNGSKSINATAFKDYNFQFLTQLTINYPTIEVTAFPYTNGGVRTIRIHKITITEHVPTPAFTITPSSLNVPCGSTNPQTFIVNNVYNSPGTLSYDWNLGTSSNGWIYNNLQAPQTFSTTTNSISLTPSSSATSLSNVSVTVKLDGNNYTTITSTITVTNPTYAINGDNLFCTTSNNYLIPNLPAGASVHWDVSPQGIVTINSPNSSQTTLTKNLNGVVNLTATISNFCSGQTTKSNIVVGSITPGQVTFPIIDQAMGRFRASVDPVPGASSYQWYKNGQLVTGSTSSSNATYISIDDDPCSMYLEYDIAVEAIFNSCGTSSQSHANVYIPCDGFKYAISPNPANNSVTISVDQTNDQNMINEVRIYDQVGNIKKIKKFNKVKSATINVADIRNGNYWIEIISNFHTEKKQLMIQR